MHTDHTTVIPEHQLPEARSSRARRLVVGAAVLVGLALLAAGCGLAASRPGAADGGSGPTTSQPRFGGTVAGKPTAAASGTPADADAEPTDAADDTAEDALDAGDDSVGYPDGGGDGPLPTPEGEGGGEGVELEPVGGSGEDPCDQVLATGARLAVSPDPSVLPSGEMSSHLQITNCAAEAVDWTAATKPTVALAAAAGNLTPGSSTELAFTIDADAYEPGAIDFKIKVSEPGHNHYVDVHAFRGTFGADLVGDLGLSAGEGVGGCGNQCIVKAWLTANATTPNVKLEVGTNTPAKISAYVSPNAPQVDDDGSPHFGGLAPVATSAAGTTSWTANLAPLQPAKKYHLIVKAIDADGDVAHRTTSFTTITPVVGPGDLIGGEPGCGGQCITKALLIPTDDPTTMDLALKSHTPARFTVWASTEAPVMVGGVPALGDLAPIAANHELVETWDVSLSGLTPDTGYHIVVGATDAEDRRSYRVGTFHTAGQPGTDLLIVFQKIHVTHDGDSSWHNRGELSFRWGTAEFTVGSRGEEKIDDATTIGLNPAHATFVAPDVEGFLPTLFVSGSERDADGIAEFCSMGLGVALDPGSNGDCDAKWNVASSGLVTVESLDGMARCSEFDLGGSLADAACMVFETPSNGDDYARFQVLVSVQPA